jgi:GH25 family lysozyme M1 (1,4-beta-N-acetylmuramidase)
VHPSPAAVIAATAALALLAAGGAATVSPAAAAPTAAPRTIAPRTIVPPTTLAAARAAMEALPHSPQLLAQLAGSPAVGQAAIADRAAPVVHGIDVASFQHPRGRAIQWTSVAKAGYRFAAIKGTEGNYYVNPWGRRDVAEAKAAGLYVSVYHFAVPNVSGGAEQARYAVQHSRYASGGHMLPLELDIEYDPYVADDGTNECYGLSRAGMRDWIRSFISTVYRLTGQRPVIYTPPQWWNACTGGTRDFNADPLWVASYRAGRPQLPRGWPTWTFWQYTSSGTVRGVDSAGTTDLDRFNGGVVGLIDPGNQRSRTGTRVSLHVSALDTLAGRRLSYSSSGLPRGLAINGSGTIVHRISGPAKTYHVTIRAKNTSGSVSAVRFSWRVT